MPSEFIATEVMGLKELQDKLKKLPPEVADIGVDEANAYLVDVLKLYPPKKSVSRKQAYPHLSFTTPGRQFGGTTGNSQSGSWFSGGTTIVGYSSWAQFKLVMALVHSGRVPYDRTQTLRNNWQIIGKGANSIIANETPYAAFVMGDGEQASGLREVGWQTINKILLDRTAKIVEKFDGAVKKAGSKIGLEVK